MRASGEDQAGRHAPWPTPPAPWSGGWRPRRVPWLLWVAAAVVLALIQIVGTHFASSRQAETRPLDALAIVILAAGPGLLLLLRRWPGPIAAAVVALTVGYFSLGYPWGPVLASPALALVVATGAGARRWTWSVGGALIVGALAVAFATGEWIRAAAVAAWTVVVLLVGEGLRVRRERFAERRREWDARRREARDQERLELARDIHDVVAHSLSLINVRASVALHLADRRPEELRPALEAIKEASHEALGEVRELLGVLRQDVPVTPGEPLERIPSLVEDARGMGLEATLDTRLDPPPSPALQRIAYRVVQEALTNAVRHAGAHRVAVRLAREGGHVVVDVRDDGAGLRGAAAGSGLRGMRERVEAVGGSLELADDGGLHVRAELPEARQNGGGAA